MRKQSNQMFLRRCIGTLCMLFCGVAAPADEGGKLSTVDHYVKVKSAAPAIIGKEATLYVREVVLADKVSRAPGTHEGVVLFVHGGGTPGYVSFDVPHGTYSWMGYLARAGYDVFSVDLTGYGRSTRPAAMDDPCNALPAEQAQLVPKLIAAPCAPSHTQPITTIESDWHDLDAVIDHLRALRRVERVSLVAWSRAGLRVGGYTARHPAKVGRVVALAPTYQPDEAATMPDPPFASPGVMTLQSQAGFTRQWDRQVGCPGQYDPAVKEIVWKELVASDELGAKWGTGVRRAPRQLLNGFGKTAAAGITTPYLIVLGTHDNQAAPARVRQLYADLGSKQKIFVEIACASHNVMWEKNHLLLFRASLEFLKEGKVNGVNAGELKLGF